MTLSELLKDLVARSRRSQNDYAAQVLGISPSTLSRYIAGDIPKAATLRRLAEKTGVPEKTFLEAAGFLPDEDERDPDELPLWLVQALPLLKKLDSDEARVVEGTAQSLLELREARAKYGEEE